MPKKESAMEPDREKRDEAAKPADVSKEQTEEATRQLYRDEDSAHRGEDDDVP
jgi:hypothetical protein